MEETEKTEFKPKKKNGGARPNSGPKKGSKQKRTRIKEAAALRLTKKIEEKIDELADALVTKALTGDVAGLKEAFERGLGKVKDTHEHDIVTTVLVRFLDEGKNN